MKGHKFMNYKHITTNERCCIANFLSLGLSLRKIAKHLKRNVSTISREVKRNSTNVQEKLRETLLMVNI